MAALQPDVDARMIDISGMDLEMAAPAKPLSSFISAYFLADVKTATPLVDYSVPEWGSVRFPIRGGLTVTMGPGEELALRAPFVQGPTSKSFRFSMADCRLLGIGFLPAAFARFWDTDMSSIANAVVPINHVMGTTADAFADAAKAETDPKAVFKLADAYFMGLLNSSRGTNLTQHVTQLHRLLNDPDIRRIEDLAEIMGLGMSTVTSLCKRRFGFPPKQLQRRQRFLRTLDALHARPYAEWPDFVDPQYSDQSHMIRDFKYFMGLSPSQYLALPRLIQQASAIHRTKAVGGALQGLD